MEEKVVCIKKKTLPTYNDTRLVFLIRCIFYFAFILDRQPRSTKYKTIFSKSFLKRSSTQTRYKRNCFSVQHLAALPLIRLGTFFSNLSLDRYIPGSQAGYWSLSRTLCEHLGFAILLKGTGAELWSYSGTYYWNTFHGLLVPGLEPGTLPFSVQFRTCCFITAKHRYIQMPEQFPFCIYIWGTVF